MCWRTQRNCNKCGSSCRSDDTEKWRVICKQTQCQEKGRCASCYKCNRLQRCESAYPLTTTFISTACNENWSSEDNTLESIAISPLLEIDIPDVPNNDFISFIVSFCKFSIFDGKGYIYIMTDSPLDKLESPTSRFKIGSTRHPKKRELQFSAANLDIRLIYVFRVPKRMAAQRHVHRHLAELRIRKDREWFRSSLQPLLSSVAECLKQLPL